MTDLAQFDLNHLWHPFTQHRVWQEFAPPLIIERASGVYLVDTSGRRYLDGVSSLWCNVHGHGTPELVAALKEQAELLCHSTLLGLSHVPVLELTERLLKFVPSSLTRAFYSDSGSAAVEAALRMAVEWWQNQPQSAARKRSKFVSLVGSYHGDTLGAVGVGYLPEFHAHLKPILVTARRFRPPHVVRVMEKLSEEEALAASIAELRQLLTAEGDEIAALIMEPLVQGAAGIWLQPAEFLTEVAALCRHHEVILIADEVATGFGKTGKMFAINHGPITPDILVLGKGLSAGYLPMSACLATERLFEGFLGEPSEHRAFAYGQTFAGNPLAARVARASLDLFLSSNLLSQVESRIMYFHDELIQKIQPLDCVAELRMCGLMVGIELTRKAGEYLPFNANDKVGWRIVRQARSRGLCIRPLGNVIILMPALVMEQSDLTRLVDLLRDSIVAELGS